MQTSLRFIVNCIMPLLLAGCGGTSGLAPVDSRGMHAESGAATRAAHGKRGLAPGDPDYYVVKRGDTLYSIAWQHGLTYQQLAAGNGIRHPYTIYAGQRLRLKPGTAERPAAPPRVRTSAAPAASKPVAAPPPAARPASQPVARQAAPAPASAAAPAGNSQAAEYDGRWVWPARGRILRSFQSDGVGKKGIDIGGHDGQPVNAAASGKVVYVGSGLVGYGRLIIIKHNENLLSAYGHNSKLLVAEGENVKAGQQIAEMGSSGTNRTGLYFEIRKDGKPVNPLKYLPSS